MRHSTFISANVAPNCFRTVVGEYGITCYYSVCVGNKLDLNAVEFDYLNNRNLIAPDEDTPAFIQVHRVVNREITFYKTPYKQCYPNSYTQHFGFIIFKCYTPYRCIRSFTDINLINYHTIREMILDMKFFYPNNK